jgi:hypothetical protein
MKALAEDVSKKHKPEHLLKLITDSKLQRQRMKLVKRIGDIKIPDLSMRKANSPEVFQNSPNLNQSIFGDEEIQDKFTNIKISESRLFPHFNDFILKLISERKNLTI